MEHYDTEEFTLITSPLLLPTNIYTNSTPEASTGHYALHEVTPLASPLLVPFRPKLEPDPLNWGSDDETDFEDIIDSQDTPWNRALRDRKRPPGRDDDIQPSLSKKNRHAANWRDMILVHEMDPRRGWDVAAEAAGDPLPSDDWVDWVDQDYLDDLENRGKLPDLSTPPDFNRLPLLNLRALAAQAIQARKPLEPESQYSPETPLPPMNLRSRRRRKRFALPLLVARPSGAPVEVMACPDSGSDENIISLELATSLGLKTVQTSSDEPRQFTVANGKIVTAVGQVSTSCRFAAGAPSDITKLECIFHVFNTLAVPLIMGVDFLQQTETLSKHRDRLVEQVVPAMQSLRVNSVGRPKRSLVCRLDTYVGCATVDTGSDLNLVSPAFAKARAYKIEPAYEQLEFADCSVGSTSGVIRTSLAVGNVNDLGFHPRGEPIDLELFVLDNLNADILVGQDTVDMLDVFNLHSESLIPSMPRLGESDINIIRHIGSLEKGGANLWSKVKRNLGGNSSGSSDGVTGNAEAQVDMDQRENARRERERARIAKLSGSDRQRAQELEDMTIQAFESERRGGLPSLRDVLGDIHPKAIQGEYSCTFPGCTALPFQTQYLLNSHANIHSSARPHHCPFEGCPRAKGGKGFKREDEMIRHRLVHRPPKYIHPF